MKRRTAQDCRTMAELRDQIDDLDRDLIALFAERERFIDRAGELKVGEGLPARIDERVEQVVSNVRSAARDAGTDEVLVESLWRRLIEWSIAREEAVLNREPAHNAHNEQ